MKFDTVIQGVGLTVLSIGLSIALYNLAFFSISEDHLETICTIQNAKYSPSQNQDISSVLYVDVVFPVVKQDKYGEISETEELAKGIMEIPVENCKSKEECLDKLEVM